MLSVWRVPKPDVVSQLFPDAMVIAADTSLGVTGRFWASQNPKYMPLPFGHNSLVENMMFFEASVCVQTEKIQYSGTYTG